jgi:hypothetical protein
VLAVARLVEGNTICEEELLDNPTNVEVRDQLCPTEALTDDGAVLSPTLHLLFMCMQLYVCPVAMVAGSVIISSNVIEYYNNS